MKSRPQMIADMLALQAKLNDRAFPEWRTNTPDYDLAIISECSELIDSVGWKWWKKQEPRPLVQTQMEVIDIWHFVMSGLLAAGTEHILFENYDHASPSPKVLACPASPGAVLISAKKLLASLSGEDRELASAFFHLAAKTRLSVADIYRLYAGKATLNLFRWDCGYAEGLYVKDWLGEEDNDYLEKIIANAGDELDPVKIRAALNLRYEFVLSQQPKV